MYTNISVIDAGAVGGTVQLTRWCYALRVCKRAPS